MRHRKAIARAAGFSLVEVLVALIVISVGLLGIAKMQALALSNTSSARLRSLAAIQAASLASTIHADRVYWVSATNITVSATATPGSVATATDATLNAAIAAAAAANALDPTQSCVQGAAGSLAPCTPVEVAAADVQTWVNDLTTLMPTAQVSIACDNSTPLICTVKLTWTENSVAVNKQSVGQANAFTASQYILYVQP